jgi:hypothetical protein
LGFSASFLTEARREMSIMRHLINASPEAISLSARHTAWSKIGNQHKEVRQFGLSDVVAYPQHGG